MELIEIVNENGIKTGEIVDKEIAHDRNLLHNEIAIFIINNNNEVLLQKRSSNKRFNPNKWALCAGHVDAHESLEEAAVREMYEEVGLKRQINELISFSDKEITLRKENSHITYFFYTVSNQKAEDFKIQIEELSEVKWFKIADVITMINNNDSTIVFDKKRLSIFEQLYNLSLNI